MKKRVITVACLVLAMLLCACEAKVEGRVNRNENLGKVLIETTCVPTQPETTEAKNEFFNDQNNFYSEGEVSIRPRHLYWDGDVLVAQCFVINGLNEKVSKIKVDQLKFGNDDGVIANAQFGELEDLTLSPYCHVLWTFYFGEDVVEMVDADLSSLNYYSSVSYRH